MGIFVSPGVFSVEKDISTIVPAVSSTVAAIVGYSNKGTLDLNLITDKQQFIAEYGEPVPGNYFHYSALAFLEKGNVLYCKRVIHEALHAGAHIVDGSDSEYENIGFDAGRAEKVFYDQSDVVGEIFSILTKDPGVWGNKISIKITDVKDDSEGIEETDQFTFVIEVYYTDSEGTTSLVESWKVSREHKVDGYGKQLYLMDKINKYSSYIFVANNVLALPTVLPMVQDVGLALAGGYNGIDPTASDFVDGWDEFANPENIDIRILIGGGFLSTHSVGDIVTVQLKMKEIAESRKDCIAILDVPQSETGDVDDTVEYRTVTQNINSSYTALYAPWVKINDPYNDMIVELPPSGYIASQIAYNDYAANYWNAPAGFNRGMLNVLGLTKVYTQGERDVLYVNGINPMQTFRGSGNVIWGQKTQQKKASALDRVNVRRLLIITEKSISIALNSFVYESNDDITRARIEAMVDEFMDELSAKGAFQTSGADKGYAIVCDTRNNTPAIIDLNELHVDVFVKPIKAAEFIRLQTIITTTGVSFNELVSRGVMF